MHDGTTICCDSHRPLFRVLCFAAVIGLIATVAWAQECKLWEEAGHTGPHERALHAMVFDEQRGVAVLFGGRSSGPYGDTWEWDRLRWTLAAEDGPGPRYAHAMAYDAQRNVTVLFGGRDGDGNFFDDTWEWDGANWMLVADHGPSARRGHEMVYDSRAGVVLLFGGFDGDYRDDIWAWNGTRWSRVAEGGPAPRAGHALAYDSGRGVTVMFGGKDAKGKARRDTWEWNGVRWNKVYGRVPSRGHFSEMVYDSQRGVTLLMGGVSDRGRDDITYEWDGSHWRRVSYTGPTWRSRHAMAYDPERGVTVLFGGLFVSYNRETWVWARKCSCRGSEQIRKAVCKPRKLGSRLVVSLARGLPGERFAARLRNNVVRYGTLDHRGRGKAVFSTRLPPGESTVQVTFGCGAEDEVEFSCPGNASDTCEDAPAVGIPSINSASTRSATIDEGFPACGQGTEVIAPGVWYRVTGTGRTLHADTCADANFNTKLNVYENGCDNPICVVGNNNSCEDRSAVVWDSVEGVEYWILVHGTLNEVGEFELNVSEAGDLNCDDIETLRLQCDPDNSDLVATLETSLPEGWYLNLTLNDEVSQPARVSNRGIAVAVFEDVAPGAQRVCVDECPGRCELVECP